MTLRKIIPCVIFIGGLVVACDYDSALCFFPGILLMLFACLLWLKRLERQHDHSSDSGKHA
jgi:hypothetical protein